MLSRLPNHLRERTRLLNDQPSSWPPADAMPGRFLLYWMVTAVRVDENPALDVACHLSSQLRCPLLVYHGLSERYPYASDRHHTFILEGARDVQADLRERGVSYLFHLQREGTRGDVLRDLARRASVVITEDFPVDPVRRWQSHLARTIKAPVLTVDTACVLPMQVVGQAYDRAFRFRQATQSGIDQRLRRPWPADVPTPRPFPADDVPVQGIDFSQAEVEGLVAQCNIDHTVAPVIHTRGGSQAGYDRWNTFKSDAIRHYHGRRNNALVDGVSRLSAYLHYGMVSPFRVAREAALLSGPGPEKFLDELLIWRELAYSFCRFRPDHGRWSALPDWARQTLERHREDPREERYAWETLARGETSDRLWNAAQKSLLIHGELHNNVRMTWGKTLLQWHADPRQALKTAIDLNHRYALDGRDPASYGGILWCFGQFDRPFEPEQPIIGTTRARSTRDHARRLDPNAYYRKTTRPLFDHRVKVAVVGAGMSGLVCARTLSDHGLDVTVFDKGRGPGGRMSARRSEAGVFDHGAQYFTARDKTFRRYVESWQQVGVVAPWRARIAVIDRNGVKESHGSTKRFVGTPAMNAIARHLSHGLDVVQGTRVTQVEKSQGRWQLRADEKVLGEFDWVALSAPAEQTHALLPMDSSLCDLVSRVRIQPCWALMIGFRKPVPVDYDGAFVHDSCLSWMANNRSKPGRSGTLETWTLHASSAWSAEHLEQDTKWIENAMLEEFARLTACNKDCVDHCVAHRWRFALPTELLTYRCGIDGQRQLGICGDWCDGPRVEGAFLSGAALAGRIMGHCHQSLAPHPSQPSKQLTLFD